MEEREARQIARGLQRKGLPASAYDTGSNLGYAILDYTTNMMYASPWQMPPEWLTAYRTLLNPGPRHTHKPDATVLCLACQRLARGESEEVELY
jgi:hypothetical protein